MYFHAILHLATIKETKYDVKQFICYTGQLKLG